MGQEKDALKESASIIQEIEERLEQAISKKKGQIEKDLEERIKREKEEAEKEIEKIEKDFTEEKQALTSYRDTVREYEDNKVSLRNQIKEHLDKAVQFQREIETLTANTLQELHNVDELSRKLEDIHKKAEEKASVLKKDLEEKFGVSAELLKTREYKEVELNLEQELEKLKKIKELLAIPEAEGKEQAEEEEEKKVEEKEEKEEEMAEEEKAEEKAGAEEIEAEKVKGKKEEKLEEETEVEPQVPEEEKIKEEEPEAVKEGGEKELEAETRQKLEDLSKTLENYQKAETIEENGEISYFQKNDKIVLDGKGLILALNNRLDEAKKLYAKLPHSESPKDQFFMKQEIIKHQEALRKVILRGVSMCEKEDCSLPSYTLDILNMDVLKEILEKLNMENWSNEEDFSFFEKYTKNLKDNYDARIAPPETYLKSIVEELGIE